MAPPKQVCIQANWHEVSRVLGLPSTNQALPVHTACPLCHGERLSIYQDSISGGCWHYCFSCGSTGDLIELAAAVWKVSVSEALVRLAYEGVPIPAESLTEESVNGYLKGHRAFQQRLRTLWNKSRAALVHERMVDANMIRKRLGLIDAVSKERTLKGPARLFGVAPATAMAHAFCPSLPEGGVSHAKSPFQGRGWTEVVIVPYWSAPGQISAIYAIGRQAGPNDQVMATVPGPGVHSEHLNRREAGLAGLPTILELTSPAVLAVSNTTTFLKMQMRHFATSTKPLPLVAWYAGKMGVTHTAWDTLHHRRLVFWERTVTPEVLLQCHDTGGDLIVCGPVNNSARAMNHYLRYQSARDLYQRLIAEARPWRESVATWLQRAPDATIMQLIDKLEQGGHNAKEILRECDPDHRLLGKRSPPCTRRATVSNVQFMEQGGQWFRCNKTAKHRLILNGTICVDRIILRGKQIEYVGDIRIGPKSIPFRTGRFQSAAESIDYFHLTAMQAGEHLYFERGFDLLKIALAFHEPQIVRGKSHVGWDGQAFRFKHFSIKAGHVKIHDERLFTVDCPGPQVSSFRLCDTGIAQLGNKSVEAEVSWAVLISLLTSILGPPDAQPGPQTILAVSDNYPAVRTMLERCGVGSRTLCRKTGRHDLRKLVWHHKWPVVVNPGNAVVVGKMNRWLMSSGFPRVVHFASTAGAAAMLLSEGVQVICYEKLLRSAVLAKIPLDQALLSFLRHASAQMPIQLTPGRSWWDTVQEKVVAWLEGLGADATAAKACRRWVSLAEDDDSLRQIVSQLYRRGILRIEGQDMLKRSVRVLFDERGLVVTREQLAQAASNALGVPVDLTEYPEQVVVESKWFN
jgi:hypothetical protein